MNIVVVGVGYVGLITGLGLAKLDHKVQFVDIDEKKINKLNKNIAPFFEPQLEHYLSDEKILKNITFKNDYEEIIWSDIDVIMVCVQTPSLNNSGVDVSFLENVFKSIEKFSKNESIVCVKSTIHPAALNKVIDSSNIEDTRIVFNPEFLREGTAFDDFFNPDRIVIGAINEENSKKVLELYKNIESRVILTDPISSQLIKYLSNAYLPLRLSFVNEAAQIIKQLGGNLSQTLEGIGLDKRIGNEYFRPSPGWGGSCFPKDVEEINSISKSNNLLTPLLSTIKDSNEKHKSWFANYLEDIKNQKNYKNIILIGLAFKENTDDLRYSPTLSIYELLSSSSKNIYVYDEYFKKYENINFLHSFLEDSLIVEMYPLSGDFQDNVNNELKKINKYTYIRFWE